MAQSPTSIPPPINQPTGSARSLAALDAARWRVALGLTAVAVAVYFGFILLVVVLLKFVKPALGKMLGDRTKGIEETFRKMGLAPKSGLALTGVRAEAAGRAGDGGGRHRDAPDDPRGSGAHRGGAILDDGHAVHRSGHDGLRQRVRQVLVTWMDGMSTGLMVAEGLCDAQKACAFTGSWNDPVKKAPVKARMTSRWTSPTTEVFEMYGPGKDGKEAKMMEITYTKK